MFRPCSTLLVVLVIAEPGGAQAPSTAAWNLAVGDYTIHGHTTYTPSVSLLPRIVFDTARGIDSARFVDSVTASRVPAAGFAAGLSAWPESFYCAGPATATIQQMDPRIVLDRVQRAARCGVRLVIVPPRRLISATGLTGGAFSVDSARRVTDRYASVLPPDTLRKYRRTILGFNLADDYGCTTCWGGRAITQAEIATWASYARTRLPGVPLGVRVTPDWVAAHPPLAPLLDYAWAQYHTRKGEPQAYYQNAATIAERLGLRLVMGVNVEDCYGVSTAPCTASDLARFGTLALSHPASCAFLNWRYEEARWQQPEIRAVWDTLMLLAKRREGRDCRRGTSGIQ
jgi:hypothetical protein